MLNADTKRRINACRDILVGKIPNPQAQVEQITLALMYKFMNDLDHEAVDLGGRASFFAGEFAAYSWDRITDLKLGGDERLRLYAEGIEKVVANPSVPELFRQIFRNAYLPYRDPETFNLFAREISGFAYDHSEDLGDAFEYLLSIMQSQGDAGQFRTPRHIIDFMVEVVKPGPGDTVLDPACGTAGFLIAAYKYIRRTNPDLTPAQIEDLHRNVEGYDISPDMVRLSRVNLYLHQFADPRVTEYDTLTSVDYWGHRADVILANPPFMTPKGGIRPHRKFRLESNRSEVLFVDYITEHLMAGGRAAVIVPEGIIFQSGKAYRALRRLLVESHLWAVASLPAGVFNPYSGVKTSILFFDRSLAEHKAPVLFTTIAADGYDLGAQRRAVAANDLPAALALLNDAHDRLARGEVPTDFHDSLEGHALKHLFVPRAALLAEADCNLSGERYRVSVAAGPQKWPRVKLGSVCEVNPGKSETKELDDEMEVSFVPMEDLRERDSRFYPRQSRKLGEVRKAYTYFRNGDVLLARVTPCFENGKAGIAAGLKNGIGFGSSEYTVIRPRDKILPELVYRILLSEGFRQSGVDCMTGTGGLQRVPTAFVDGFEIPLPPLSVQQEMVAEVGRYQAVIDGARQVVDHWKPSFAVDPEWPVVKLGDSGIEIIDGDRGANYPKKEEFSSTGHCVFLNTGNVKVGHFDFAALEFISPERDEKLRKGKLRRGDIVLTTRGTIGNIACYSSEIPFDHMRINSGMVILRPDTNLWCAQFVTEVFQSTHGLGQIDRLLSGSAQPQLPIRSLESFELSHPPLDVQQAIVDRIEAERSLVDANKKLIELMKVRIEETMARVWG